MAGFRELIVWQKAMTLVKSVYTLTSSLPKSEQFGLVGQARRAAVSIPANIAEGHGRNSRKDYARFLVAARGSLRELETLLLLIDDLEYAVTGEELKQCNEVSRLLSGLISKMQA